VALRLDIPRLAARDGAVWGPASPCRRLELGALIMTFRSRSQAASALVVVYLLCFLAFVSMAALAAALPGDMPVTVISQPAASNDARFGHDVTIWDDWLAIGAPFDDSTGNNTGSVYLYQSVNGVWSLRQRLNLPQGDPDDIFGWSVSMDENWLVVGAPESDLFGAGQGAIFTFERTNAGIWEFRQTISSLHGGPGANFGYDVAIANSEHGFLITAGAYDGDVSNVADAGYAEVWRRTTGDFSLAARIDNPQPNPVDRFGVSVAQWQGRILIGCYGDDSFALNGGAAFHYRLEPSVDGSTLTAELEQIIFPQERQPGTFFGYSVALDGDRAAMGCYGESSQELNEGAVYAYTRRQRDGDQYIFAIDEIIRPPDSRVTNEFFGSTVALRDDVMAICSPQFDFVGPQTQPGYVIAYRRGGGVSTQYPRVTQLPTTGATAGAQVGVGLAVYGDTVVAGAPFQVSDGVSRGAVWVGTLPPAAPPAPNAKASIGGIEVNIVPQDRHLVRRQLLKSPTRSTGQWGRIVTAGIRSIFVGLTEFEEVEEFYRNTDDDRWRFTRLVRSPSPGLDQDFGAHIRTAPLAIGAPKLQVGGGDERGGIFCYEFDLDQNMTSYWRLNATLVHPNPNAPRGHGRSFAIGPVFAGSYTMISCPSPEANSSLAPEMYAHYRNPLPPGTWGTAQPFSAKPGVAYSHRPGANMELIGTTLFVSADQPGGNIDLYTLDGQNWIYFQTIDVECTSLLDDPEGNPFQIEGERLWVRDQGSSTRRRLAIGRQPSGAWGIVGVAGAFETLSTSYAIETKSYQVTGTVDGLRLTIQDRANSQFIRSTDQLLPSFLIEPPRMPADRVIALDDSSFLFLPGYHPDVLPYQPGIALEYNINPAYRTHVYLGPSAAGPFTKMTVSPVLATSITVAVPDGNYYVATTTVAADGTESALTLAINPIMLRRESGIALR